MYALQLRSVNYKRIHTTQLTMRSCEISTLSKVFSSYHLVQDPAEMGLYVFRFMNNIRIHTRELDA